MALKIHKGRCSLCHSFIKDKFYRKSFRENKSQILVSKLTCLECVEKEKWRKYELPSM